LTLWVPCLDRHCRLSLNYLSHPKRALHGLGAKSAGRAAGACSPSAVREFVVNRPGATIPQRGVTRSGFLAGFQGLSPYGIHVDSVLGVSETGVVSARLDAAGATANYVAQAGDPTSSLRVLMGLKVWF